ncbi:hypothetical protein IIA16_07115, partial [bacterium]|nr:hypothetical protein [bacterium]
MDFQALTVGLLAGAGLAWLMGGRRWQERALRAEAALAAEADAALSAETVFKAAAQ